MIRWRSNISEICKIVWQVSINTLCMLLSIRDNYVKACNVSIHINHVRNQMFFLSRRILGPLIFLSSMLLILGRDQGCLLTLIHSMLYWFTNYQQCLCDQPHIREVDNDVTMHKKLCSAASLLLNSFYSCMNEYCELLKSIDSHDQLKL